MNKQHNNPVTPQYYPVHLLERAISYLDGTTSDMIIQLELGFAEPLDEARLKRACQLTLIAEPLLQCRFVDNRHSPYWSHYTGPEVQLCFIAKDIAEYERFKLQSLDPQTQPLLKVCLFNQSNAGAQMLIKISHYLCDASGAKYISSLVARFYRRLAKHPNFVPKPSEIHHRGVDRIIGNIPAQQMASLYNDHKSELEQQHQLKPLSLNIPAAPAEDLLYLTMLIDQTQLSQIKTFAKAHHATLNDILLAAYIRALAEVSQWQGEQSLSISSTVDYRRYQQDTRGSSIANLSTTLNDWPNLGLQLGDDLSQTLQRVNQITTAGKEGYLGVGSLLNMLTSMAPMRHGLAKGIMEDGITHQIAEGTMAAGFGNNGPISLSEVTFDNKPLTAHILPSPFYPPQFVLDVSGYDGTLTFAIGTFSAQRQIARKVLRAIRQQLLNH